MMIIFYIVPKIYLILFIQWVLQQEIFLTMNFVWFLFCLSCQSCYFIQTLNFFFYFIFKYENEKDFLVELCLQYENITCHPEQNNTEKI